MMTRLQWLMLLEIGLLMILVGCGNGESAQIAPTVEPTVVASATSRPTDSPTPLPSATPLPSETATAIPIPTETPLPPTPTASATTSLTAALTDIAMSERVFPIQSVDSITTYRYRFTLTINDLTPTTRTNLPLGGSVLVGAVSKNVGRQEVQVQGANVPDQFLREVESKVYVWQVADAVWRHDPTLRTRLDPDKMILLSAAQLEPFLAEMTLVGEEELHGRLAVHYQASHDTLADISAVNGQPTYRDEVADSGADIWIDAEERFVVRIERRFMSPAFSTRSGEMGTLKMELDFYDVNSEIVVEGLDTPPEGIE